MTTPAKQQYSDEWNANTGWWAEKLLREERPSSFSNFERVHSGASSVWRNAALIVALVLALIYSVVSLAAG